MKVFTLIFMSCALIDLRAVNFIWQESSSVLTKIFSIEHVGRSFSVDNFQMKLTPSTFIFKS